MKSPNIMKSFFLLPLLALTLNLNAQNYTGYLKVDPHKLTPKVVKQDTALERMLPAYNTIVNFYAENNIEPPSENITNFLSENLRPDGWGRIGVAARNNPVSKNLLEDGAEFGAVNNGMIQLYAELQRLSILMDKNHSRHKRAKQYTGSEGKKFVKNAQNAGITLRDIKAEKQKLTRNSGKLSRVYNPESQPILQAAMHTYISEYHTFRNNQTAGAGVGGKGFGNGSKGSPGEFVRKASKKQLLHHGYILRGG